MSKWIKNYTSPAFVICFIVLAVSCVGLDILIEKLNPYSKKLKAPLIKSLDDIDEYRLWPYKVVKKTKIKNREILESLGTKDYIQWVLEDTTAPKNSPHRYASLFVTYYTGINDRIPHVPEECYFGAGSERLGTNNVKMQLDCPELNPGTTKKIDVPVRVLTFARSSVGSLAGKEVFNVSYFFKVNNSYASGRTEARNILGLNIFGKYSYFSKVEWRFFGVSENADYEETLKASVPLLEKVLPVLELEHWPNLKKLNEDTQAP